MNRVLEDLRKDIAQEMQKERTNLEKKLNDLSYSDKKIEDISSTIAVQVTQELESKLPSKVESLVNSKMMNATHSIHEAVGQIVQKYFDSNQHWLQVVTCFYVRNVLFIFLFQSFGAF